MDPFLAALAQYGISGVVIAALVWWLRDTQAKLIAEKDARIADASAVRTEVVRVKDEAHQRDVELAGAVKSLTQAVDILADVTEKQRGAVPRGRA